MRGVTLRRPGIPVGLGAWDRAYLAHVGLGRTVERALDAQVGRQHHHHNMVCIYARTGTRTIT